MGIYVDGGGSSVNFAAGYIAERTVAFPYSWPNNGVISETTLRVQLYENNSSNPEYGTTSPYAAGYLVSKGPRKQIGAGLVETEYVYSEIPAAWNENQIVAYTFPGLSGGIAENWSPYYFRAAITLYVVANVSHQFSQGAAPVPAAPFIVSDNGNVVDYIGTSNPNYSPNIVTDPFSEPSEYIISGSVNLVRPTIWENVTIRTPKPI